MSYLPPPPR